MMGAIKKVVKSVVKTVTGGSSKKDSYDAEAERIKAENQAEEKANAQKAADKKRRQQNSLLAAGAGNTEADQTGSVSASGKKRFGAG